MRARLQTPPHRAVGATPLELAGVLPDEERDVLLVNQLASSEREGGRGEKGAEWGTPLNMEWGWVVGKRLRG
jgi:hypothetical protein